MFIPLSSGYRPGKIKTTPNASKGAKSLDINYDFYKKSVMTSNIFVKLLLKGDIELKKQCHEIVLLIDNCAVHLYDCDSNCRTSKIFFLIANTTFKLQPLDHGIMKNFILALE